MNFTWNVNPEIIALGPFSLRYYGLLFVVVFLGGFYLLKWQMERVGWKEDDVSDFIIPGMLAVIIGARLGHVLFYEPSSYFSQPIEILKFWKGGLASHGATLGLIVAIIYFAKKKGMAITEVADRFSFSATLGAALVRLGNFFNSEIVGRITDQSWGVRFPRCHEDRHLTAIGEQVPLRHPSQLYEFGMAAFIMLVLWGVDRKLGEKRPRGLLGALFLSLYFTARFIVEFFKEYQTGLKDHQLLTMGQVLSIPIALAGYIWLFIAIKQNVPAQSKVPQYPEENSEKPAPSRNASRRKNRRK